MLAVAAMVFGAVSCNKEKETNDLSNRPVRLTATTEGYGDTKTDLHGHALTWSDGDQIKVMCENFTTADVYQVRQGGSNHAEFVYAGDEANEPTLVAPFKAGYPAEYWNADVTTITLPAQQNYVENGMEKFPMYGEVAEGMGVDFKNLCGVIRLRLVKPNESVTKIVLSTTKYMNGEFGVSFTEGVPAIEHLNGGDNFITLNCAEPVSINSATDFYIYLPAGTYNPMRIEVYNNRGLLCEMNSTANITIERNKITTIAPSAESLKFNYVAGLISVSDNQQVRFASGNLQYVRATSTFQFASSQYEVLQVPYASSSTNNPVLTTDPIVDLFYISNGTTNNYGADYLTTSLNVNDFVDWCNALPDNTEGWRTLSAAEWSYAMSSASSNNRRRNYWGYAKITDESTNTVVRGMVLVPDYWTAPEGFRFKNWGRTDNFTTGLGWEHQWVNQYTTEEWKTLEQAGAVFLPGYEESTDFNGYYWTSSAKSATNWNMINVKNHAPYSTGVNYGGVRALAVRLAQNYQPLTITE